AIETLRQRGDVLAAGAGGSIPPDGFGSIEAVQRPSGRGPAGILYVLPGYFEALGVPLVSGRVFTRDDLDDGARAVLSQSAAHALFPDGDALGRTFSDGGGRQFSVIGI